MNPIPRREFIKNSALAGTGLAFMSHLGVPSALAAANTGNYLRKWAQPLRGLTALGDPNGIPVLQGIADPVFPNTVFYQITAGEFTDRLHPLMPNPTRLWGYWDTTNPVKRHLAGVIVANRGQAVRIRVTNTLPAQHILPVDALPPLLLPGEQAQNRTAIHLHGGFIPWISDGGPFDWWSPTGASGASFLNGRGPGSLFDNIPGRPMQANQADYFFPNDQSCRLMWYHDHAHGITRLNAYAGLATGYLVLDAVNDLYAGGDRLNGIPGVSPIPGLASTIPLIWQDKTFVSQTTLVTDPTWKTVTRPDVQKPGSLWYEHLYNPLDLAPPTVPPRPATPNPSVVPEFFGDTMLCNGTVFPILTVEAKRYRFMMLNATNARFLNINLFEVGATNVEGITLANINPDPLTPPVLFPTNTPGPAMIQIGTEGGFLLQEVSHVSPKPVDLVNFTGNLLLGNAERADVIIDFTGLKDKHFVMYSDAPGPFPGGGPDTDYFVGNNDPLMPVRTRPGYGPDTRQLLRIKVVAGAADAQPAGPILNPLLIDPPLLSAPPAGWTAGTPLPAPAGAAIRDLSLNEDFDSYGRLIQMLGTMTPLNPLVSPFLGREYMAPPTEIPTPGTTEVWRIWNTTADSHPIHFHLVNVQVLSRQPFVIDPITGVITYDPLNPGFPLLTGVARGPEPEEVGWKETVKMNPGEVILVTMKFELPATPFSVPSSPRAASMGLDPALKWHEYVWHCHILEHEEHDMMRPLMVGGDPFRVTSLQEIRSIPTDPKATFTTAVFFVTGGSGPYTVTPGAGALPAVIIPGGVRVDVPKGTPVTPFGSEMLYTVTDSTAQSVTVKLRIF